MSSVTRILFRQSCVFQTRTIRPFSSTFIAQKSVTETVKDTAHKIDKAVASKIVDGIEIGQTATQKAKSAAGISTQEAKSETKSTASEVSGKASELTGEAKGKAAELKGQAKGKANEVAGKL